MARITQPTRLERVEHILGSGVGILDFAVENESGYYTWEGDEDAQWSIDDVESVENTDEDRFIVYPKGDYFVCKIEPKEGSASVRCWCE